MSRAVVLSDMFCHYKAPESFSASNLFLPWKKLTNPSNAQLKIIPNKCIIYSRRVTFTENDILSQKINANLCRLSRPVCWQSFTFICVTGRCTILTLYHILLACFFYLTCISGGGEVELSKKAAKPVTPVQDCVSTSDYFLLCSWRTGFLNLSKWF